MIMSAFTKISDLLITKTNQFQVYNKPGGLPVQPDKTQDNSILDLAQAYHKATLFPINRIDRPASGIVLFATSSQAASNLNQQLSAHQIQRTYLAVVPKTETPLKASTLVHYLKPGRNNKMLVFDKETSGAKKAVTAITPLSVGDRWQLIQLDLQTGRHHQIRAQLSHISLPIKGDVKYGAKRGEKDRSILLHSWKMSFKHPISSEQIQIEAQPPASNLWNALLNNL